MEREMKRAQRIREWAKSQFQPCYVDWVTEDLISVSTGNRNGNRFETEALKLIFPEDAIPPDPKTPWDYTVESWFGPRQVKS